MKDKKYEYVQRINSHYVGDDCVQFMLPSFFDSNMVLLNCNGIVYYYGLDSTLFINKYNFDQRKWQFPYANIPIHADFLGFKKVNYINQLLNFNKIYIQIEGGIVKEYFALKDNDEALVASSYILPTCSKENFMNRKQVMDILDSANGGIFFKDSKICKNDVLIDEDLILESYKSYLIKNTTNRHDYFDDGTPFKDCFYSILDNMTIDNVPQNTIVSDDIFVVSTGNDINSIKLISIRFMKADCYKVTSVDFPIKSYSLEELKEMELTDYKEYKEPRFPIFFNVSIDREKIKKEKSKVLELKKKL